MPRFQLVWMTFIVVICPFWAIAGQFDKAPPGTSCEDQTQVSADPVLDIRNFLLELEPVLTVRAKKYLEINGSTSQQSDPWASAFCEGFVNLALPKLREQFPHFAWQRIETLREIGGENLHVFIYNPELDLVIDGTYRQFLKNKTDQPNGISNFFIGSPAEYEGVLKKYLSDGDMRSLILVLNSKRQQQTPNELLQRVRARVRDRI